MLKFGNQHVEFKQEYVQDIRKEVLAFVNAEGGTVFVEVRKDGAVTGIGDPDEGIREMIIQNSGKSYENAHVR